MCKRPINPILPTAESDTISFLQKVEFIDWQLAQLQAKVDGMTVEGNVDTSADDPVLESIQIGDDKFRVVGTDVEGNVTISGGEESLASIQIGETVYKIDGTSDTDSGTGTIYESANPSKSMGISWSRCGMLLSIGFGDFSNLDTETLLPTAYIEGLPLTPDQYYIPFTSCYLDASNQKIVLIGRLLVTYVDATRASLLFSPDLYFVDGVISSITNASFAMLQGLNGATLSLLLHPGE